MSSREYYKQYYQKNKEARKEQSRQCRTANIAKYRERDSKYHKEHPEVSKKAGLKYRQNNPDKERERHKRYRQAHTDEIRAYTFSKRGKGYLPINSHKRGYSAHHLFLESNNAFCVYIPEFVHSFYHHNSKTGEGMGTINAVALSVFIDGDDQFL